jgi:hypothetical protein
MDSGRYFSEVGLASCLKRILDEAVTSAKAAGSLLEISRGGKEDRKTGHASPKDRKDLRLILKKESPTLRESERNTRKECDKKHIPAKSGKQILHYKRSLRQLLPPKPEISSF